MFKAGFAETNITPEQFPVTTYMGQVEAALDPLFAQCGYFSDGATEVLLFSVNVVMLEFPLVDKIRAAISACSGVPVDNIMLSATHNHACPAVIARPHYPREEGYLLFLCERLTECAAKARENAAAAVLALGRGYEKRINFNRRFVKRDGTVVSQPRSNKELLCNEGVVDPEVGVCRITDPTGNIRAIIVNFACHAVHLMGQLSGGYPGVLRKVLKQKYGSDCSVLFLNGPCGNIIHRNFENAGSSDNKDFSGECLAEDVVGVLASAMATVSPRLTVRNTRLRGFYRPLAELRENIGNMEQLNVLPSVLKIGWYDWSLQELEKMHSTADGEDFTVQTFLFGEDFSITAVPCEYFSQYALRIKERHPREYVFLAAPANGWLGYVPFSGCFERKGGHETTTAYWSKMAYDTGDKIEAAVLQNLAKR